MTTLNKYENVLPVVYSTGGFYNPNKEEDKLGEFYLQLNGIPKMIEISYKGNISILNNREFQKNVLISNNSQKGLMVLSSTKPYEYSSEKLFSFSGNINLVKYVKIYNWADVSIYSSVINYDQTHVPLNASKTNLEDDSIIIRDIKIIKKSYKNILKKKTTIITPSQIEKEEGQLRLPNSYANNRIVDTIFDDEGVEISAPHIRGQYCHNCVFFEKLNYCKKWSAEVAPNGWGKSWKEKGIK